MATLIFKKIGFSQIKKQVLPSSGHACEKYMAIVYEFADVFPKELSCLPPHGEMDFSIELYPSTYPI